MTTPTATYSGPEVARAVGVPYAVFDNWIRRYGLIPCVQPATGFGSKRRFSKADRDRAAVIMTLESQGYSVKALQRIADRLNRWATLPPYIIVVDRQALKATSPAEAVALVASQQTYATIIDVAAVTDVTERLQFIQHPTTGHRLVICADCYWTARAERDPEAQQLINDHNQVAHPTEGQ
jgi:DNA-binding transcriptional MerR regulator